MAFPIWPYPNARHVCYWFSRNSVIKIKKFSFKTKSKANLILGKFNYRLSRSSNRIFNGLRKIRINKARRFSRDSNIRICEKSHKDAYKRNLHFKTETRISQLCKQRVVCYKVQL